LKHASNVMKPFPNTTSESIPILLELGGYFFGVA